MQTDITQQLADTLQNTFHFSEFRPGQLEALTTLMTEGRLLCIQPTGYGKSLLYQLPAVLLDGITLVISPLLALMRDQTRQLQERFKIEAASFNTDQSDEENQSARIAAQKGEVKILFIAPEQLDHVDRFNFLLELPVKLLVVDEAHCISTWGHDFRPSYRHIMKLTHALVKKTPEIKLLALTATANKKTEDDIKQQFTVNQRPLVVHRENMNRPNIRLSVLQTKGAAQKLATITTLLQELSGSGLIYCATRENAELVAEFLVSRNIKAVAYHAGFDTAEKRQIQNDFINDQYPVIAATNALGMGIDKPNLRFIIHFDFPGSITAYYQEVGRCGRDGLPAEGILLYDPNDSRIQEHFIASAQPTPDDFQQVRNAIDAFGKSPNLTAIRHMTGMHPTKLLVIVTELVEQNFLKKVTRDGLQTYQSLQQKGEPNLLRYETQYTVRNAELAAMKHFAEETNKCFMATLREALGDHVAPVCEKCSNCAKIPFATVIDNDLISQTRSWLNRRILPIVLNKKIQNTAPGIAVLDGKLRSENFIQFMRQRTSNDALGISDSLLQLIKTCLTDLAKSHQPSCIVPLPTKTWNGRNAVINLFAKHLKIPVLFDLLYWNPQTQLSRQGELLNNDQRQHNVAGNLNLLKNTKIPPGTILLCDDYTGSGATLNEAAKILREHLPSNTKIVPFTIAAVKWRMGRRGMI